MKSLLLLLPVLLLLPQKSWAESMPIQPWKLIKSAEKTAKRLNTRIRDKRDKEEILEELLKLHLAWENGLQFPIPPSQQDLWRQYCQISLGILSDVEHQIQIGYHAQAARSLRRLPELLGRMKSDFRPGLWKRLLSGLGLI
ncbi:MAG: hypothetical protein HY402_00875 [Elusimicrobia bacterium]|nr:hypothetical protein [Elusimicrobiota bacterium]